MRLAQSGPWLIADLGREQEVLSFAPHRPGLVRASRIIWREVRNSDLTPISTPSAGWTKALMLRALRQTGPASP
ncbi:hypothetical protein [Paracoccus cavernae]|uniref:hypothetical protein n=1 Tax=Paracoccus cavernae TaxID=1571207 RepID=UPI0036438470